MPGRVFAAAAVAGALIAVAFVVKGGSVTTGPNAPKVDYAVVLDDTRGAKVDLASYQGKPMVLNLWATWCGPCRLETPQLVALSEKYKAQGLVILGVSTDDPLDAVKAFADEFKVTYPMLVGRGHEAWLERIGYTGTLPFSLLVDKSGNVVAQITGLETTPGWESHIEGLLK